MQQEEEGTLIDFGDEEQKRGEVRAPRTSSQPQVDQEPKIIFQAT